MGNLSLSKTACIALVLCAATAIPSPAQTFTTLAVFNGTNGWGPGYETLIQGTDGNLYGTTLGVGGPNGNCITNCGTIFKITPAGTLTPLHSFEGPDGTTPQAGLVQGADGNFYGTTYAGGANGYGTVFKITPGSTLITLHSFNSTDGGNPLAGLVQATDGNFYGTTAVGGGNGGYGTVFKITPGGTLTTLYSFDYAHGFSPFGWLVQATDGNFYGTTSSGGTNGDGTVFKITPGGTLTTLHSFDGTDGANPRAGLVQGTDGNFYGTTSNGGTKNVTACASFGYAGCGTVFKITPGARSPHFTASITRTARILSPGWCKPVTGTSTAQPARAGQAAATVRSSKSLPEVRLPRYTASTLLRRGGFLSEGCFKPPTGSSTGRPTVAGLMVALSSACPSPLAHS